MRQAAATGYVAAVFVVTHPHRSTVPASFSLYETPRRFPWLFLLLALVAGVLQAWSLAWPWRLDGWEAWYGQPLWWLQIASLAMLAALLTRMHRPWHAALLGWGFATAWLCATFWWLYISMHVYGGLAAPLAVLAVVALAAFLGSYYAAACGLFVAYKGTRPGRAVLLFAALWLLGELARGEWWTGFPWGAGGYAHTDGPLAALAPWIGVYGIGAVASAIAMAIGAGHFGQWQSYAAGVGTAAVLWLVPLATSPQAPARAPVSVALLQGNISQGEKFQPSSGIPQALGWYADELQQSSATMVIAPETAIPVLLRQTPDAYWPALQQRFASGNQAALIGVPLGDLEAGYTNSMVGLVPGHSTDYRYDKHHLVPFGEFIPPLFRWFTDLMQIPLGDFNRGGVNQPSLAWAGERWAPNICYEDLFGEELATRFVDAATAPTILVNASNIGWFGGSIAIDQHLQISRMRSLELARPMVRATNTGATAIIDHRGVVRQALPHQSRAVLLGQVQGMDAPPTFFAQWAGRWGLWPLWAWGLLVLVVAMLTRRRDH